MLAQITNSMTNIDYSLPVATILGHYKIIKTLSCGGFSIVYLALDQTNKQKVVIKEYLPQRLAVRDSSQKVVSKSAQCFEKLNEGRRQFFQEAEILSKLSHPNIVHITNFFNANDTVYMVMDYRVGKTLQAYIKEQHGLLREAFLRFIFPSLLDGLRAVHEAGLLHLDIKPGNILLRDDGSPMLLDFGGVMRMKMSRQYQPRAVVTQGFSPIEQYQAKGYVGPWTDIYAIGATIRSCIEGRSPPSAQERHEQDIMKPAVDAFKRRYPAPLLHALDWAMEINPELRPQNIDDFVAAFMAKTGPDNMKWANTVIGHFVNHLPWTK